MGRAPCCVKEGLRKGPWSAKEDSSLTNYIKEHGEGQWRSLPKNSGLLRCGKSCRLRWMNYLRPGIKRGNFSEDEDDLIVRLHSLLGNRWSLIAGRLPGRTDNEIKNYWNTHLLKKLKSAGIVPKPHKIFSKKKSRKKPQQEKKAKKKNNSKKCQNLQVEKTKVFVPKPIRISCGISRNNSFENVTSSTTCSSNSSEDVDVDVEIENNKNGIMNNENEVNDFDFCEVLDGDTLCDEFLMEECCHFPNKGSVPMNESKVEKVYEEYLLLLSENCYLQEDQRDPFTGNISELM